MPVLAVGLNFRGVSLDLLERFAFTSADLPKALHAARASEQVREAVILSTCNRTEVYAAVGGFHAGIGALRQFLSDYHHVPLTEFADRLYSLYEDQAVSHLFGVASGIDSMVIGEPHILTQVRRAFTLADEEHAVGSTLSALFRQAIRVGRRARAETDIARTAMTFAGAASRLAHESLGELAGRTVLVIGAGKMSDLAAAAFAREGADVLVANRTATRAHAVATRVRGRAVAMEHLPSALAQADLILSSTGSPDPIITREMVSAAMSERQGRPLVLLDIAVPRDVDPEVAALEGVTLRDMDDLRDAVAPTRDQVQEVDRVRAIVMEEAKRFAAWQRAHALAPLLAALQERAERVRTSELKRAAGALAELDERQRDTVEAVTRSIVAKMLHDPITHAKALAGSAEGEALARTLRNLYRLPDKEA